MSIEQAVEELYGDTWTEEQKEEEIKRLKEEQGLIEVEEPKIKDGPDNRTILTLMIQMNREMVVTMNKRKPGPYDISRIYPR